MPDAIEHVKLSDAAKYLLEECRMVLPGIQALFGFQLVAVYDDRFTELSGLDQALHFAAVGCTAISVALIMTPAAYHRSIGVQVVSEQFIRNSTRLLLASMPPLGLAISMDFYLVGRLVFDAAWPAAAGAVLFALFVFMWVAFPRSKALQRLLDRLPGERKSP
ncbi:MAG TPA: DUF6328 family protein [Usitatibacter sp.]|nr:DUF6328 family protein [Usitatibacter sp.]